MRETKRERQKRERETKRPRKRAGESNGVKKRKVTRKTETR
jgi:hypothetical protein